MCAHKSILLGYKCSDSQIRQEHDRSEANRVQNDEVSRYNHINSNKWMK